MLNKYTSALILALLTADATAVNLDDLGFPDSNDCEGTPFAQFCKDYCTFFSPEDDLCDPYDEVLSACLDEPRMAQCGAYCDSENANGDSICDKWYQQTADQAAAAAEAEANAADAEAEANTDAAEAEANADDAATGEEAPCGEEPINRNNVQVSIAFNVDVKKAHHDDTAVSAREQSIVDALAAAGEALGAAEAGLEQAAENAAASDAAADADADADAGADDAAEPTGTLTHAHYVLSDVTLVNGTSWGTLKASVMADVDAYKGPGGDYIDLDALNKAIVDALIAAQTELGDDAAELVGTEATKIDYYEPLPEPPVELPTLQLYVSLKDENTIAGTTWSDWKTTTTVMEFGFMQSPTFTDLSNLDQALIIAHMSGQFATGDNAGPLGDGDDVQAEITWTEDESNEATGSTDVCVYLNDLTEVGGMDWQDLRETAMSADYTSSDDYANLDARDVVLVDALIAQQELEDSEDSDLVESIASLEIQTASV